MNAGYVLRISIDSAIIKMKSKVVIKMMYLLHMFQPFNDHIKIIKIMISKTNVYYKFKTVHSSRPSALLNGNVKSV